MISFRAALLGSYALIVAVTMELSAVAQPGCVSLPANVHETSGLTCSNRGPQWLWTINDSDNGAELLELSTAGKLGRILTVKGATNIDCKLLSLLSDNKCYTFALSRPFDITSFDPVHPVSTVELDSRQAEGLCYGSNGELYVSSESRDSHPATLIQLRGK